MFSHPGVGPLKYSGSLEALREKKKLGMASGPLERKSTALLRDGHMTPPTTAGTEILESDRSFSPLSTDGLPTPQRQRSKYRKHIPIEIDMPSPKAVEVYQPSRGPIENYSRPRKPWQADSVAVTQTCDREHRYIAVTTSHRGEKRLTVKPSIEADLNQIETRKLPPSPEVYTPSKPILENIFPVAKAGIETYQPRSGDTTVTNTKDENVKPPRNVLRKPQNRARQKRQMPSTPPNTKPPPSPRYTPLEPWVAEHQRKLTDDTIHDMPTKPDVKIEEDIEAFKVIQRYLDTQTGSPTSPTKVQRHSFVPSPPNIPLPASPEPHVQKPFRETSGVFSVHDLDVSTEPPSSSLEPNRSVKRLTTPKIMRTSKSVTSIDGDFAFAADGKYSPYEEQIKASKVTKKRNRKSLNVGQAARAGSSRLGRMAPPILGHDALTTSGYLGLNDLSYYLKHTGPPLEPELGLKGREKRAIRILPVKNKKTLAARVGTVEGSPQRVRRHFRVPACAREVTTQGGVKHLKIIVPAETYSSSQGYPLVLPASRRKRRSRHVSITFTEEMFSPLASPEVERILASCENRFEKSFTEATLPEANLTKPRSPKRAPKSTTPVPVPVENHPLASREDQTRARKLRDLQRIKQKPPPLYEQGYQHPNSIAGAPLTPAQTPEPQSDSFSDHLQEGSSADGDDDSVASGPRVKTTRLQKKVALLHRQNIELTEALAKIMGVRSGEDNLTAEDVLRMFRQAPIPLSPISE